jgi:hypothetical protein
MMLIFKEFSSDQEKAWKLSKRGVGRRIMDVVGLDRFLVVMLVVGLCFSVYLLLDP